MDSLTATCTCTCMLECHMCCISPLAWWRGWSVQSHDHSCHRRTRTRHRPRWAGYHGNGPRRWRTRGRRSWRTRWTLPSQLWPVQQATSADWHTWRPGGRTTWAGSWRGRWTRIHWTWRSLVPWPWDRSVDWAGTDSAGCGRNAGRRNTRQPESSY